MGEEEGISGRRRRRRGRSSLEGPEKEVKEEGTGPDSPLLALSPRQ